MASLRGVGRTVGATAGVLAATAATGVAAERYAVHRLRRRPDPRAAETFEPLPADRTWTVPTSDGAHLYAEDVGPLGAEFTVVLAHGWTLELASWYFQRRELAVPGESGPARFVFYDQRWHGRSSGVPGVPITMARLGDDLGAVIDACAPGSRLVLVGHSMGGMAIMALAARRPELFERVAGVALLATAAGGLNRAMFGLPELPARAAHTVAPYALAGLRRAGGVVDRARSVGSDVAWLATWWSGFGSSGVSPAVVSFAEKMITATPIAAIADLYHPIIGHDERVGVASLGGRPVLVLSGERDRMTPARLAREVADAVPGSRLDLLPNTGHLLMLERPDEVTSRLRGLLIAAGVDGVRR